MTTNFPPSVTNTPLSFERLEEVLVTKGLELPKENPIIKKIRELQGMARIEIDKAIKGILFFVFPHDGNKRGKWVARLNFSENGFGQLEISNCLNELNLEASTKDFFYSQKYGSS